MKKLLILLFVLGTTTIVSSCISQKRIDKNDFISPQKLENVFNEHEYTVLYFWTGWCSGSQITMKEVYIPLYKRIKETELDVEMLFLASDLKVSQEALRKLRSDGNSSYYLENSGKYPIKNRLAIRKTLNDLFPDNDIAEIKFKTFSIPVIVIINKEGELIDTGDTIPYLFLLNLVKEAENQAI